MCCIIFCYYIVLAEDTKTSETFHLVIKDASSLDNLFEQDIS